MNHEVKICSNCQGTGIEVTFGHGFSGAPSEVCHVCNGAKTVPKYNISKNDICNSQIE